MILRAFGVRERCLAVRWAAAGGAALLADPVLTARAADESPASGPAPAGPFVAPGRWAGYAGRLVCWDRVAMAGLLRGFGLVFRVRHGVGTVWERGHLLARPFGWCAVAAMAFAHGVDRPLSREWAGRLWRIITRWRPLFVYPEEIRDEWEDSAPPNRKGYTPWRLERPAWTLCGPNGFPDEPGGADGPGRVSHRMALLCVEGAERYKDIHAMRSRHCEAVACLRKGDADRCLGAAVWRGCSPGAEYLGRVPTDPRALSRAEFLWRCRSAGRTGTEADHLREGGYV